MAMMVLVAAGLCGSGCKRKTANQNVARYSTAEGTHEKIQELRLQLTAALEKKDLKYIHDSMYYFRALLETLSERVSAENKQRVDRVLADLTHIAEAIDNSAGRGNQAATEANIQKLIERLKELETELKAGK
jgi:polyhydroxyalkanoate synthesis regulator phasin